MMNNFDCHKKNTGRGRPLRHVWFNFNVLSRVTDKYFLSSDREPKFINLLRSNNITHIVNITLDQPLLFIENIKMKKIPVDDTEDVDIITVILDVFRWLQSDPSHCGVLIHCNCGISRSPSVLMGLLVIENQFKSFDEVYAFVKARRACVNINRGFFEQLNKNFNFLFNFRNHRQQLK